MYLHWVFCYLALVWCVSGDKALCNTTDYSSIYAALLEELGVLEDNSTMKQIRPLTEGNNATEVYVSLIVTSITDVNEKAQSISTQVTLLTVWYTKDLWNYSDFCEIDSFLAPKDLFWTPDIVVVER
nr:neuronal acetylcholine receptor subunit beta-3-like [Misgurnus anguillicaudatus]